MSYKTSTRSEPEQQVALPAVTNLLIYCEEIHIKMTQVSFDMLMGLPRPTLEPKENTEASILFETSLNEPKDREEKKEKLFSVLFYSNRTKSDFNLRQQKHNSW